VHAFEAEVLRKSPGHEIENTCDTGLSIAHAAPPDVSLPAVSSIGGLRTPAPVCAAPPSWGRHPKTFTTTEVRNGLGISKMVDTIAQAFRACRRRADARLTLPS